MNDPDQLLRNGRVIDPAAGLDAICDLLIRSGRVEAVGANLGCPDGAIVFDASGLVIAPGLVDPHCHLRTPGGEHKETIESAAAAAAAGGYTSVVAMANTDPVVDNPAVLRDIDERARAACVNIAQIATISQGMKGRELSNMGQLVAAGAVGFSDDGIPVESARLLRTAFEYANRFSRPVANHAEEPSLIAGASMHEGRVSARLGLTGAPHQAEEIMLERDLRLAVLTGGCYHALHLSSGGSVEIVKLAKQRGANVAAEVSPHHLTLTDELVAGDGASTGAFDSQAKVNPPLRSARHVEVLCEGLSEGVFDLIGTDHAPHAEHEKHLPFEEAASGFSSFETALSVMLGLVANNVLSLPRLLSLMTKNPARLYRLPAGSLTPGALADVVAIDLAREWTVDRHALISRGHNTPLHGRKLRGRAVVTWVAGQVVYDLDRRVAKP